MPAFTPRQVLVTSSIVDMGLTVIKIMGGWLLNSHVLVVDGIHSLSDLVTDLLAFFLMRLGSQQPDPDHPYGHARFETFGTLMLGSSLLLVAGILIYDSAMRLASQEAVASPEPTVLLIAVTSIILKEWLYRISLATAHRVGSDLLLGNAWHHRSDALSSVMVFLGVGGALLGVAWFEFLASIGVSAMIANVGWGLARSSVEELVDTALSPEKSDRIVRTALAVDGVRSVHSLRTRKMGSKILLDIHLQVDSAVSVSEGHQIGDWMTRALLHEIPDIADVVFHIDAENDVDSEQAPAEQSMAPLRGEVMTMLQDSWRGIPFSAEIQNLQLHYLDAGIEVEVYLPMALLGRRGYSHEAFLDATQQAAGQLPWITRLSVWYG